MKVDRSVASSYTGMMNTYMTAADRRKDILQIACGMAEVTHYKDIRLEKLAKECGTVKGNIIRLMDTMENFRTLLIGYALYHGRDAIIAQAIIDRHPVVNHLDTECRKRILAAMV